MKEEITHSLARTLELSVTYQRAGMDNNGREARAREMADISNPLQRRLAQGIEHFAETHPQAAWRTLDGLARHIAGLQLVGTGYYSTVYRSGEQIIKIIRSTAQLPEQEREAYAATANLECARAAAILPDTITPQRFGVEQHPFGKHTIVVASQRFVAGATLDLFDFCKPTLRHATVDEYLVGAIDGATELGKIVDGAFAMNDAYSLAPDINGRDNLRVTTPEGRLSLIDARPTSVVDNPWGHDLLLRQADVLGAYLDRVG